MAKQKSSFEQQSCIIAFRAPQKLLAQIRQRNSSRSKFIRKACLQAIRFEHLLSHAEKTGLKASALRVVEK